MVILDGLKCCINVLLSQREIKILTNLELIKYQLPYQYKILNNKGVFNSSRYLMFLANSFAILNIQNCQIEKNCF